MLIDNLHRINSPSDLFKYICELEEIMEADNEVLKQTAKKYLNTRKALQLFLAKDGWHCTNTCSTSLSPYPPITGRTLDVYITASDAEDDIVGIFETAFYYPEEGFRLCEAYKGWKVRYWRYLGEEDCAG